MIKTCEEILDGLASRFEAKMNIHLKEQNEIDPNIDPRGYAFQDGLAEGYKRALEDVKFGIRMLGQAE